MVEWWTGLSGTAQGFFIFAAFFSALFIWQLIAALMGLGGGAEDFEIDAGVDADVGADVDVGPDVDVDVHADLDADIAPGEHPEFEQGAQLDGTATMVSFKLLSFRSILAFCLLFTWAGGLYLSEGAPLSRALPYAAGWGLGAMVIMALLFYGLAHLAETGTPRIATCVGTEGTVHLNIPVQGTGEARVTVSGVLTHVKARGRGGQEIPAGTPIRVRRALGPRTVEVEPVETTT